LEVASRKNSRRQKQKAHNDETATAAQPLCSPFYRMSQSPVIQRLTSFLKEEPADFEIAILSSNVSSEEEGANENNNSITGRAALLEVSIVQHERHLGLDARALPWMTREIKQEYKALRKMFKTSGKASETKEQSSSRQMMMMIDATACLLLVNPDHATAWADRRRSLLHLETFLNSFCWKKELAFVNLLMTQHSKA
jgi:hypothetical protein